MTKEPKNMSDEEIELEIENMKTPLERQIDREMRRRELSQEQIKRISSLSNPI